jgi:hypothetical protein
MREIKARILDAYSYTELVYERINKKLNVNLSKNEVELFIAEILDNTNERDFVKRGKNYYVTNAQKNIRITINSNTFRIITVDKIKK